MPPDDKKDPAAPQQPMPPQGTAPFGMPWAFPHNYQPPPVVDLKKETNWLEIWKFIIAVVPVLIGLGTLIYKSGQRDEKVESLARVFATTAAQQDQKINTVVDAAQKANASAGAALLGVHDINDQLKRLNLTKRNRPVPSRRPPPDDLPLPPTP